MKKIAFLLSALLLIGGGASAQKKNVSKAKSKILAETPDTRAAKEAILPALTDSTTKNEAATWYVAGDVYSKIYEEQQKLLWSPAKNGDRAAMAEAVGKSFDYYLIADSLDKLPNAKGKVAPKFHKNIVEKIKKMQRSFTESAGYYYDQKDFKNALKFFDRYISYSSLPIMAGQGLEKDTLIPMITYYCGLCATLGNMPEQAVKYYEVVKDINSPAIDSKWVYSQLCNDYGVLKDTANMIRVLKIGAQKFPSETFYIHSLINYYLNKSKLDEALSWVSQAIDHDPNSAALWNVKGRILEVNNIEAAKDAYKKAIEMDPNNADALGNIGRLYYNKAVEELERVNAIKDDKKYKAEKVKLKALFETPRPYFEKALSLSPGERDFIIALRGIYYNLGMDAKYKEMDELFKSSKKK